ncbi:MAG: CpsD/CapB family tyrosine-protein kinase [Clostridia bacterium]|nr:CpsD/CapB family tyrosine-protein kinase [Clostridia bacterium]
MKNVTIKNFPALGYSANEALNTLATNLTFSGPEYRKILITSCHLSEGKSFLSMNIVRTLAKIGYRVALVDCDLRRSELARKYFRFEDGQYMGVSNYLAGHAEMEDIIFESNIPNLRIVPRGKAVVNSLPLISSDRLGKLLDALQEENDYVIVDAPPVGMIVDAARIASYCDGTVLIVSYNSVRRRELVDSKSQIEQSGCPILGTVINQADFSDYVNRKYYKNDYYHYYYMNGAGKKHAKTRHENAPAETDRDESKA